jgi:hypothetical protein
VRREFNVLALIKGSERFVYVYDDRSLAALLDAIRDQASDPACRLNWFDASILTQRAKEQALASGQKSAAARSRI